MESAILLFLSPMRDNAPEEYTGYIPGRGDLTVSGIQTNDAPCKFLLHLAASNLDRIGTVLCLASRQVLDPGAAGESAYDRFRQVMTEYLSQTQDQNLKRMYQDRLPKFVAVAYDFDPARDGVEVVIQDRSNHIYRQIARSIPQNQFRQLYIDYTGGFRDAGFLLTELSRFLEFVDIPCRQIVYSNYADKKILSLQGAYEMFPILSGISSFINTGNAAGLQRAYRLHGHPLVDALLENMTKFAQAVSVCAMGELDALWENMDRSIQALEQYQPTAETDVTILMLQDFLPKIRKKLKIKPGSAAPSYLPLIRWCLDNEMLQQAMTLFAEKIPAICFENNLLTQELLERSERSREKKEQNAHFCTDSYQYALYVYLFNSLASDPEITEFLRYCRALANNLATNRRVDRAVQKLNNMNWSKQTLKSGVRLIEFIMSNFDRATLRVLHPNTPIYHKCLADYGQDAYAFVDAIRTEYEGVAAHYFVHNDYSRYRTMTQLRNQSLKRCALEVLSGNRTDVAMFTRLNCRQLKDLLQYCYLVKLLRNQTNHAKEEDQADYQYFTNQGVFRSQATLYEISREVLTDALDFFEMMT